MFEGAAQLVGAGGAFAAAADAVDAGDDIVDFLATDQLADALQVAVASAKEEDLLDDNCEQVPWVWYCMCFVFIVDPVF